MSGTQPATSTLVNTSRSGCGSRVSHWQRRRTSLRWNPAEPRSIESVSSPSWAASFPRRGTDPPQQPGVVEQTVEELGEVAKQTESLLQIDVDAAEEDLVDRDVFLVGLDGCVHRDQLHVDSQLRQGAGQGVVVHAAAAVHAGGTGGEVRDA